MPTHTYLPGLRLVLQAALRYGTRYTATLAETLTDAEFACLQTTLTAIATCLQLLGKATPEA